MERVEIKRFVLSVVIDGVEYQVKAPSVKLVSEFEKNEKKSDLLECLKFLEKLGLPLEISEQLEPNHIEDIFTKIINGVKKN